MIKSRLVKQCPLIAAQIAALVAEQRIDDRSNVAIAKSAFATRRLHAAARAEHFDRMTPITTVFDRTGVDYCISKRVPKYDDLSEYSNVYDTVHIDYAPTDDNWTIGDEIAFNMDFYNNNSWE